MPDPPLQFEAEPFEALCLRFPAALEHVYDVAGIKHNRATRPGECRANVFDCEDGVRLIVSVEDPGDGGAHFLHVSGSIQKSSRSGDEVAAEARARGNEAALKRFREICEARYRELSCDSAPMDFLGFTGGAGIPHWCGPYPRPTTSQPTKGGVSC